MLTVFPSLFPVDIAQHGLFWTIKLVVMCQRTCQVLHLYLGVTFECLCWHLMAVKWKWIVTINENPSSVIKCQLLCSWQRCQQGWRSHQPAGISTKVIFIVWHVLEVLSVQHQKIWKAIVPHTCSQSPVLLFASLLRWEIGAMKAQPAKNMMKFEVGKTIQDRRNYLAEQVLKLRGERWRNAK